MEKHTKIIQLFLILLRENVVHTENNNKITCWETNSIVQIPRSYTENEGHIFYFKRK